MVNSNDVRAPAAEPDSRPIISRVFGVAMLAEAITFGVASYLHLDGRIQLGFTTISGEQFRGAAIPEAIIGAVLAVGAALVLAGSGRARAIALGTTGFAILGVLFGLHAILGGTKPAGAADLTYHSVILAALLVTFIMLLRQRARSR